MQLDQKYSEDELVQLLLKEDQEAFAYLYDNYAPALNGIIVRLVQDKLLAEDILQEVFLKIWNNFSGYDKRKGSLFSWMINLAKNLATNTLRSRGYTEQPKNFDENLASKMQGTPFGADRFDAPGITKQLSKLKADLRLVIELAYFHGRTQDEIANEIDIPLGTVKIKMRTAILELRKILRQN